MSEQINIPETTDKSEKYKALYPQLKALLDEKNELISNLSNLIAALKETFGFFWIGFYLVKGNQLILGPFQGSLACTTIGLGSGVCGKAWEQKESIVVGDVSSFPGHIACDSRSKSEVVIPVFNNAKEVVMVLDIDSDVVNAFDQTDVEHLKKILNLLNFTRSDIL